MAAMRELHGIWADGALCLWAEGVPCAALADLLEPLTDLARKGTDSELAMLLPADLSAGFAAIATDPTDKSAGSAMRRVRVPVLRFEPAAALDLIVALDDGPLADDTTLTAGASIPY